MPEALNYGFPVDRVLNQVNSLYRTIEERLVAEISLQQDAQDRETYDTAKAKEEAFLEVKILMDELFEEWNRRNDPKDREDS